MRAPPSRVELLKEKYFRQKNLQSLTRRRLLEQVLQQQYELRKPLHWLDHESEEGDAVVGGDLLHLQEVGHRALALGLLEETEKGMYRRAVSIIKTFLKLLKENLFFMKNICSIQQKSKYQTLMLIYIFVISLRLV